MRESKVRQKQLHAKDAMGTHPVLSGHRSKSEILELGNLCLVQWREARALGYVAKSKDINRCHSGLVYNALIPL